MTLSVPDRRIPATIVTSRESIRLALIAALQHLPPRQRAVLILKEVVNWRAAEIAELLDTTTAAVNGALQRARAQISEVAPTREAVVEPTAPEQRKLLERYVRLRGLRRRRAREAVQRGRRLGDATVHRLVPESRGHRPRFAAPSPCRHTPVRATGWSPSSAVIRTRHRLFSASWSYRLAGHRLAGHGLPTGRTRARWRRAGRCSAR
ncbi:MAG TPA: sigma factor-like helix-turn-helix DNA-binding protein [Streptosporangiaceae bacterium]|nr:sigma factor-like helix-turn-helix DNA-binding protein [Streptosporangiaceae bacterium]